MKRVGVEPEAVVTYGESVTVTRYSQKFSLLAIFEVLVEKARYHPIIELFDLVGSFAVESLEALVAGDDVGLPGGKAAEVAADVTVKLLDLGHSTESLAVGRIGYDSAAPAGCADVARILREDAERVQDTCAVGIILCHLDHALVNIRGKNLKIDILGL